MSVSPPPNALTLEEYTKRIRAGAKTFAEIDPEMQKWVNDQQSGRNIFWLALIMVIAIFLITYGTILLCR